MDRARDIHNDVLDAERCPLDGLLHIRVVEDDGWALAAELECNLLQV